MPEASSSCFATSAKPSALSACSSSRTYWVRSTRPRLPSRAEERVAAAAAAESQTAFMLGLGPCCWAVGSLPWVMEFVVSSSRGRLASGLSGRSLPASSCSALRDVMTRTTSDPIGGAGPGPFSARGVGKLLWQQTQLSIPAAEDTTGRQMCSRPRGEGSEPRQQLGGGQRGGSAQR